MATQTGYFNLTSATAVKTELAHKYPFPKERVGEDSHTWLRYSAGGGKFSYCPEISTFYRIPRSADGSSARTRYGGKHNFNIKAAGIYEEGFKEALEIAVANSKIKPEEKSDLLIRFYLRHSETMKKQNDLALADKLIKKAMDISKIKTEALTCTMCNYTKK